MDCENSCPLPNEIQEVQKSLELAGIEVLILLSSFFFCFLPIFLVVVWYKGNFLDLNTAKLI